MYHTTVCAIRQLRRLDQTRGNRNEDWHLIERLFEYFGTNQSELSLVLASFALLVSISAVVQTAGVRRKEWRLEAVGLAAETSARAHRCQYLVTDLRDLVDAVFSLNGMSGSASNNKYREMLESNLRRGVEAEKLAESELVDLASFRGARFGLQSRIQELTKALHDIRGLEDTLVSMTNRFSDELMQLRSRQLKPAPT